jgi:hypothetical protein
MKHKKVLIILSLVVLLIVYLFFHSLLSPSLNIRIGKQTVIKQIRSLNKLETASFTIEKVIDAGTNGNDFQEFLFGDKVLLIAHGEVIAGFDLSKLNEKNILIEKETVTVTLPAPEILITKLDSKETRVYDRKQGLLTKGNKDLESEARQAAEKSIRDAACQGNILIEASKNGRNQLTTLLKAFGYTTVVLKIPTGTC